MTVIYGIVVVCGACLAAVLGLTVVQRLVPATIRKEHNDVAGFIYAVLSVIYAVLGVIYAVLLALVVIATWEEFGRARVMVETEANALAEIFWLALRLPEPEGRELQELCRSYAEEVVNVGWPLMEQGRNAFHGAFSRDFTFPRKSFEVRQKSSREILNLGDTFSSARG